MTELLTYREAAKVVHRSRRTIRYWRQQGLTMTWGIRDGQRVRLVEKRELLKYWRQRMKNDPAHQYRLRRQALEAVRHADGNAPA